MEKDEKDTVKLVKLFWPTMNISAERRKKLLQAVSDFVATTDELKTETILPLEECLRRLHKMEGVKKSNSKENEEKIQFLKTEPNKPTLPTLFPISQATISKLKAAFLNVAAQVKPTLPSKRTLPPASTTNKKRRKMMSLCRQRIPKLGRPFPKRNTIASNKTLRKSLSDELQVADKFSMIAMLKDLSVSEGQIDFGDTSK